MINYVQDKKINYKRIKQLLDKSAKLARFTNGGPVKVELERLLEETLNIAPNKKIVCACNGTTALHTLIFLYQQCSPPKKWVTIAYNFPSVVINNLDTAIIDIENTTNSYKVPLKDIPAGSAFVMPTLFGTLPANFLQLQKHCSENKITLILDNASSPLNRNSDLCNLGDASFGSLHHTKYLGFGEGGFLVVEESHYSLADAITNFGFHQSRKYHTLSSNFKISDISAAFIVSHINSYSISEHIRVQTTLVNKLKEVGITPFGYNEGVVYGNLPIKFTKPTSHLVFRDYGIEANKYYLPLKDLPNSNYLYERLVNFPLHAHLLDYEIDKIVEQIAYIESAAE